MKTLKRVDVAIVGGGWTGLAMAKEITGRTGLSVLILERGAPRKTAGYADGMDELDYAIRAPLPPRPPARARERERECKT